MPKTVTTPWDPAEHLGTEEDMAAYLEAALDDGDPALVAAALGDIARAKGMTQVAREAGLGRESLYKALSPAGNPEFATIMKVVSALGLKLHATPAEVRGAVQPPLSGRLAPEHESSGGRIAIVAKWSRALRYPLMTWKLGGCPRTFRSA